MRSTFWSALTTGIILFEIQANRRFRLA